MICNKCGAENDGSSKFCGKCGQLLSMEIYKVDNDISDIAVTETRVDKLWNNKSLIVLVIPAVVAFSLGTIYWNWVIGVVSAFIAISFIFIPKIRLFLHSFKFISIPLSILISLAFSYAGIYYYQSKISDFDLTQSSVEIKMVSAQLFSVMNWNDYHHGRINQLEFQDKFSEIYGKLLMDQQQYKNDTTPAAWKIPLGWERVAECHSKHFDVLIKYLSGIKDYSEGRMNSDELDSIYNRLKYFSNVDKNGLNTGMCMDLAESADYVEHNLEYLD